SDECTALALQDLRSYGSRIRDLKRAPWYWQLLVDADGSVFIDYLSSALTDSEGPLRRHLIRHRDAISQNMERFKDDRRILDKYLWLVDYHNFVSRRLRFRSNTVLMESPS